MDGMILKPDQGQRNEYAKEAMERAKAAYDAGDLLGAMREANAAQSFDPDWPVRGHMLHALAVITSERGDRKRAAEWWKDFFGELPSCSDFPAWKAAAAHNDYGFTLRLLGFHQEALHHFQLAEPVLRAEKPEYLAYVLTNIAWTACLVRNVSEAERALSEASRCPTDKADSYQALVANAFLWSITGRKELAMAAASCVLANGQAPAPARFKSAWLLGTMLLDAGEVNEAHKMAFRAGEIIKGDPGEARYMYDARALARRIALAIVSETQDEGA